MTDSPFRSFFMGGFECSTHRLPSGRRLDLIGSTAHDRFARDDYRRLADAGLQTIRDGVRWHLIEPRPGRFDFSSLRPMAAAARETGVQVIWDLMHYGWPDDLDIFSTAFITRFARFAAACAEVLSAETEGPPWVVPINEISFFAWAGGQVGIFNPFARRRGDALKWQLVRATVEGIEAMWAVNPGIRIVHTDPMIHVATDPARPRQKRAAERQRLAQYAALDAIGGRVMPELGGAERYLDVIGVNYYIHNQWVYPGGHGTMIEPSDPRSRPISAMLRDVHDRYRRPLFIAETGIEDEARPAWLRFVAHEVRRAIAGGVPVHGLCLYPIANHPGWDDDRHCHNGLWDYADDTGHRPVYAPLSQELAAEQERQQRFVLGHEPATAANDAHALDLAAHMMERRSRRP